MNNSGAVFDCLMVELRKEKNADNATRALVDLFELYRTDVKDHFIGCEGDGYSFHRGFRQYDVLPTGQEDMVVWNSIHDSSVFWECFNRAKG